MGGGDSSQVMRGEKSLAAIWLLSGCCKDRVIDPLQCIWPLTRWDDFLRRSVSACGPDSCSLSGAMRDP
jgi:hypothetical protein